jgi:hypothetical protein
MVFGRCQKSYLLVYSDVDAADTNTALADVGVPTNAQMFGNTTNVRTITEQGPEAGPNGISYTPVVGIPSDPGFFTGSGIDVTYNFQSDDPPIPTPEPASVILACFGAGGMLAYRWKRRPGRA